MGSGSATATRVQAASRHRLGHLREPLWREEEEEEEEQVKEMINFLFLLKLSNRISGAAGQACRESSWQGGNPRKRGPCGSAGGTGGQWNPRCLLGVPSSPHSGWDPWHGTAVRSSLMCAEGCCLTLFRVTLPGCAFYHPKMSSW